MQILTDNALWHNDFSILRGIVWLDMPNVVVDEELRGPLESFGILKIPCWP
jgi:hypothetical protein